MPNLADVIAANFGVPSPGAVNDKLINFFQKIYTFSGNPTGVVAAPPGVFGFDILNSVLYTKPTGTDASGWQVGSGGGGGSGSLNVSGPGGIAGANMGAGPISINQGAVTSAVWDGVLNVAGPCAISVTGWPPSGIYGEILIRIHQDATGGRGLTINGVSIWMGLYQPVLPTVASGVLEFTLFTIDGGTTVVGIHNQPVRIHQLKIQTPADDTLSPWIERFKNDARIVAVVPNAGGTPVTTSWVGDLFKGSQNGASATIYTTTANRPSVAAGNLFNGAVNLPDTVLLAPNDYLQGKTITASSATSVTLQVYTIEAA